ncbi:hypothetical protein TJA_23750 [Thermus sp. LT1-2-5]|uniref:ATP-dependent nuclease n=1 Tax=Thermus sp. LT1-2-5 TaxID=3026935 RepID=UPI0030E92BC8
MGKITKLSIQGYRSINERIEIRFPLKQPVVLVGENNAGKSNIVKALQLVMGPSWPGSYDPADHEFFARDNSRPIEIEVEFDDSALLGGKFKQVRWRYNPSASDPVYFRGFDLDIYNGSKGNGRNIRSEDRDTCICMVVEAERSLQYHLSYSSKWTLLSRLMHRFHRALSGNQAVKGELEDLFRQVKSKFHEIQEFKGFLDGLQQELSDLFGSMSHRLDVDFEAYNPVNFFHALRLQAAEGNEPRTLDEMGTGEQQVLALAFAYAYAKAFHGGIILVIEEPEAHLHPLAQQWLARRLRSRCEEELQIVITTHSPTFLSIEGLEGLVLVYKDKGATHVRQITKQELVQHCINHGAPRDRVTKSNILPFYAASATSEILSGFFARVVVLVEGQTEALALPILLRKVGLDVEKEGIAILSVGGKGNLGKWYRLFTAYDIPCYVVFDNDSTDDRQAEKRRDALRAIGMKDEQQIKSVIEEEGWEISDSYTVFGKDYETTMREYFAKYNELEQRAREEEGIDTKPFVARWVAEKLLKDSGDKGWDKLTVMAEKLRSKLAPRSKLTRLEDPV